MPTHGPDLSELSLTQLAALTGVAHKTAHTRLNAKGVEPVRTDGRTKFYSPRVALPVILGVGEGLNAQAEKARLDRVSADLKEEELRRIRGETATRAEWEEATVAILSAVRSRMLSVASQVAAEVAAEANPAECHAIIEAAQIEALGELAQAAPAEAEDPGARKPGGARGRRGRARKPAAAAAAKRKGVGRG